VVQAGSSSSCPCRRSCTVAPASEILSVTRLIQLLRRDTGDIGIPAGGQLLRTSIRLVRSANRPCRFRAGILILLLGRYVGDLMRTQDVGYGLGTALVGSTLTIAVLLPSAISAVSGARGPLVVLSARSIALTKQPGIIQIHTVQVGTASIMPTVAEVSVSTSRRASRGRSIQLWVVSVLSLPMRAALSDHCGSVVAILISIVRVQIVVVHLK